jgi:hypothetical protein
VQTITKDRRKQLYFSIPEEMHGLTIGKKRKKEYALGKQHGIKVDNFKFNTLQPKVYVKQLCQY